MKLEFNQSTIDSKIDEIKAMSPDERSPIINSILRDFGGWLGDTFEFTDGYQVLIKNLDPTIMENWGTNVAKALDNSNWTLVVVYPGDPEPGMEACPKATAEGGGTLSHDGHFEYEVEFKLTWTLGPH
jgi:hypothetical protein